jgi:ABC-2 type transport system ATP-binding protein
MIELHALTKRFKGNTVLDGVTLSIARGDRIALIGSNGAGKTTLIRCLLGEYVHEGEVRIGGRDPRRERETVLARVGFVPQLPPALKMPVGQLIEFAAATYRAQPAAIGAVAAQLGLETSPIRSQPFVKLSGGQKQKLLIAIALGRETDLLIMDEPAANLDPAARHAFFDLLAGRAERTTMLISSHRLDEVAPLVNRVLELDLGQVVLDDRVADDASLTDVLACRISIRRADEAFDRALGAWGFESDAQGTAWTGVIAGPDRLRFLGMLARYVGLITDVSLRERSESEVEVASV